jgi:type III pantothenate kinase
MFLAIDVVNTETKLGCFSDGPDALTENWRVTTDRHRTPDEYGIFFTQLFATGGIDASAIDGIAIASVVPQLDATLERACLRYFKVKPVFLHAHEQSLIPVATARPSEVGADLIATAIGGRFRYGAPLIIVSYGTATVFAAISPAGAYAGVAIAPGINISIDALVGRTAKLPQVALDAPERAMGRDTIEALQAGIVYGFVGQTDALVGRMRAELGVDAKVVATGGLADVVARHSATIDAVDPHLSLVGLRLFFDSPPSGRVL